ncbi:hypothetical protein Trichorick_01451 (plasmid) [Candidatus Trichorickettsia mobilis]|uniref:Uncharacterized protein n=1 Tax=Candidatus Trichorickettsia mobilis TaxID=1346319 RepID=A0ABZ0UWX5_9RICK|nr:hypothetical protein [Candidatus Trichorickettsia mobilis]WPY01538.1 hypothetical protein Trichorick_01451 [Candidatus Trichorickettsia mobilis]
MFSECVVTISGHGSSAILKNYNYDANPTQDILKENLPDKQISDNNYKLVYLTDLNEILDVTTSNLVLYFLQRDNQPVKVLLEDLFRIPPIGGSSFNNMLGFYKELKLGKEFALVEHRIYDDSNLYRLKNVLNLTKIDGGKFIKFVISASLFSEKMKKDMLALKDASFLEFDDLGQLNVEISSRAFDKLLNDERKNQILVDNFANLLLKNVLELTKVSLEQKDLDQKIFSNTLKENGIDQLIIDCLIFVRNIYVILQESEMIYKPIEREVQWFFDSFETYKNNQIENEFELAEGLENIFNELTKSKELIINHGKKISDGDVREIRLDNTCIIRFELLRKLGNHSGLAFFWSSFLESLNQFSIFIELKEDKDEIAKLQGSFTHDLILNKNQYSMRIPAESFVIFDACRSKVTPSYLMDDKGVPIQKEGKDQIIFDVF